MRYRSLGKIVTSFLPWCAIPNNTSWTSKYNRAVSADPHVRFRRLSTRFCNPPAYKPAKSGGLLAQVVADLSLRLTQNAVAKLRNDSKRIWLNSGRLSKSAERSRLCLLPPNQEESDMKKILEICARILAKTPKPCSNKLEGVVISHTEARASHQPAIWHDR